MSGITGPIASPGGPGGTGDMLKSEYDTSNVGIVDGSQKIADFGVLDENVSAGDLLYIVDAPLTPQGFPTMGIADSDDLLKRPAVAAAQVAGLSGETIVVIQDGFVGGVDTRQFAVNQEVFIGLVGKITDRTRQYVQQVGIVKNVDINGSILFKQGPVTDNGKMLQFASDAGGASAYSTDRSIGQISRQVLQKTGESSAEIMLLGVFHVDEVQQADKSVTTANPSFSIAPINNNNIVGFTLEASVTITNAFIEVLDGTTIIWQNNIGTLTGNVETSFDLTSNQRIPIDLLAGITYTARISSVDGDVILKGDAGGNPFYKLTWSDFTLNNVIVDDGRTALFSTNYIVKNSDASLTAQTGGDVVIYEKTTTTSTISGNTLIPGVASTSEPVVVIDDLAVFTAGEIVLMEGTIKNDGLYEISNQIDLALFFRGVGLTATVEDFTNDQFIREIVTATITKVKVSITRTSLTGQIEHGEGSETPIVFHQLAHASDVPIVVVQEFASDIIRFFGEFGLPTTTPNGVWTLVNGAEVTLVDDNVFGKNQQVVNVKDTNAGIGTSIENSISAQQWQNAFDFAGEFGGIVKAIAPAASNNYFFIGAGVSGPSNPTASTSNQRFGAFFKKDPSTNFLVVDDLQGPTNVVLDGTGGLPLVESGDYFEAFVAADIGFTDPRWIVNGIDVGAATFGNSNNSNDVLHIQSGSSSGVGNDFNVVNFGITILNEPTTKTFSAAAMAADIIDVITPLIAKDFENIVPDGFPRPVNAKINGTLNNVGGKYKIRTENLSSPQSLFNGLRELEKDVTSTGDKISLSNVLDNNNVYFGEFEDAIIYDHSGLIASGKVGGAQGMSIVNPTAPAVFRLEAIKAVIVDRSLNPNFPNQTFIDLPATEHTITGGGDQVVNIYINKQGVFEFRAAEPTSFSVTGEIFIGKTVMDAGVITVAVFTPNVAFTGTVDGQAELINGGGHKTNGSILSAGGANLTLSITAGSHHQIGRGFLIDVNSPNLCDTEARAVIAFTGTTGNLFLVHADSGGNFIIDQFISSSTDPDIDPTTFNPSGGASLVTVPVNDVTAKRVYQACGTNDIIIYSGTVAYANMAAAEAGFEGEDPEIKTTRDISYICTILVKETVTDLTAGVIAGDVIFKNRSGDREL